MQKITASVLLVLFVAVCIDAQRLGRGRGRGRPEGGRPGRPEGGRPGRPGGNAGGRRPPSDAMKNADAYNWDVNASPGTLIPQKAFISQENDVVVLLTMSKNLRSLNMTSSVIAMKPSTGMMVIKQAGRRSPCFLADLSATQLEIESDFAAWNDSTIELTNMVALNGTDAPLDKVVVDEMMKTNQGLGRICRAGKLVRATAMTAGTEDPDTKVLKLFGYDAQISIMVPAMPDQAEGGRPAFERPGKGRGWGRGRNNGQGQDQGQDQGQAQGRGDGQPEQGGDNGQGQGNGQDQGEGQGRGNGPRGGGRGQGGRGGPGGRGGRGGRGPGGRGQGGRFGQRN